MELPVRDRCCYQIAKIERSPSKTSPTIHKQSWLVAVSPDWNGPCFHTSYCYALSCNQGQRNKACVVPATSTRHIGHWRNRWDLWHWWHTTCPHGVRTTTGRVSRQTGHVLLVPCGSFTVSSGSSGSNFHFAQSRTCWCPLCCVLDTAESSKPSCLSLCLKVSQLWAWK